MNTRLSTIAAIRNPTAKAANITRLNLALRPIIPAPSARSASQIPRPPRSYRYSMHVWDRRRETAAGLLERAADLRSPGSLNRVGRCSELGGRSRLSRYLAERRFTHFHLLLVEG